MDGGEELASVRETRPMGHDLTNRLHQERGGLGDPTRPLEWLEGTISVVVAMASGDKLASAHGQGPRGHDS
jgi:hypothetical protein